MINSVRTTTLALANKENFGYIPASTFNLYSKQAQLSLFEDYFYRYNQWIVLQNNRESGSEHADVVKKLQEVIEIFSVPLTSLTYDSGSDFTLPTDLYMVENILSGFRAGGTTDATLANNLSDSTQNFIRTVKVGDTVNNLTDTTSATVTAVVDNNTLTLSADIMTSGEVYSIVNTSYANLNEVEKVSNYKILRLVTSLLTAPTIDYPAYVQNGTKVTVHPDSVNGGLFINYIRFPKDPKWTYQTLSGGEALFDQSQPDYQDFELPLSDEPALIAKILQYAGLSIREADVIRFMETQEQKENIQER